MIGKISTRQLMLIMIVSRVSSILVLIPVVQIGDARQDAWIASILSTLTSCLVASLPAVLAMKFPGSSFGHVAKGVLGPYIGAVATGLVALSLYIQALIRTRSMSLIVISQFLPETPGWALAVPLLAVALYGAVLGPDTIGRTAELMVTYLIGIIALGAVLLYGSKAAPVTGLKPILARGWGPVLAASVSPTFLGAVNASSVLALGRFTTKTSGILKAVVGATLISGLILLVIVVQVLITIGPQQAQQALTPVLAMASTIYVEGIVERADLLVLASWVLGLTFDVTVLLMSASIIIGDALSKSWRTVAVVLFLVGVVPASLRFTDTFSMRELRTIPVTGIWTLVVFIGTIGLVLVAALIRGKRGAKS